MPWDSVDKWRDEDYWPERAEIGSDGYVRAEIAAGRSGEEMDSAEAHAARHGRRPERSQSSHDGERVAGGLAPTLPVWPALLVWAAIFVTLALGVHA